MRTVEITHTFRLSDLAFNQCPKLQDKIRSNKSTESIRISGTHQGATIHEHQRLPASNVQGLCKYEKLTDPPKLTNSAIDTKNLYVDA